MSTPSAEGRPDAVGAPRPSLAVSVHQHGKSVVASLALAALGVVFGDIGTSPLYAFKECFAGAHPLPASEANVLGVLSLMFWSLTMVVAVKYLCFIVRADNEGEGGILALLALVRSGLNRKDGTPGFLVLLVIFGAALLYGDGVITPAISVLSAVEGLGLPASSPVAPWMITVVILIALFSVQKHGTGGIGVVFGPIMVVWFVAITLLGILPIVHHPDVLAGLSPIYGIKFLVGSGYHGFLVLGSVVLCITGGEALYADMGHFGKGPIRISWFALVMPALVVNYFGQGALVLGDASAAQSPFYGLVPKIMLYPMVALATAATVIASQALISGAFSLTRQAVQLGYCPRVTIVHTSKEHEGQIYVPEVNTALLAACVWLVVSFKSSDKLAAAYGIAVTGTMSITSVIYYVVITRVWGWSRWRAIPLVGLFLVFDLGFFAANLVKIEDGGYVPLLMGLAVFTLMTTWKTGRRKLGEQIAANAVPLDEFLAKVGTTNAPRVAGTAVFMSANPSGIPPVLAHHYAHNKVLHEQVVLLSILNENVPFVSAKRRMTVRELPEGFFQVTARFGFMETPNVPAVLEAAAIFGLAIDPETMTFYLGRETLLATGRSGMSKWRKGLFAFVSRNARTATAYFNIPPNRVVELGMQVEL